VVGPLNTIGIRKPKGLTVLEYTNVLPGDYMITSLFPGHPSWSRVRGEVYLQTTRMGRPLVTVTRVAPTP
jgi:hypothetical protein